MGLLVCSSPLALVRNSLELNHKRSAVLIGLTGIVAGVAMLSWPDISEFIRSDEPRPGQAEEVSIDAGGSSAASIPPSPADSFPITEEAPTAKFANSGETGESLSSPLPSDAEIASFEAEYKLDPAQFTADFKYAVEESYHSMFFDYGEILTVAYEMQTPCIECRQLFVDLLHDPLANLEFRVMSAHVLSGLGEYQASRALVEALIVNLEDPASQEPGGVLSILNHEISSALMDGENDQNIVAVVDYFAGRVEPSADSSATAPGHPLKPETLESLSLMIADYPNRQVVTNLLLDSFANAATEDEKNLLLGLDYPELYAGLAINEEYAGATFEKETYVDQLYRNPQPDNALRGMLLFSSKTYDDPQSLYQRTSAWAEQHSGAYDAGLPSEILMYNGSTRADKATAVALIGRLYDDSQARSILENSLNFEVDPFIRQLIERELTFTGFEAPSDEVWSN